MKINIISVILCYTVTYMSMPSGFTHAVNRKTSGDSLYFRKSTDPCGSTSRNRAYTGSEQILLN